MTAPPPPYTHGVGHFLIVLQSCTNHDVETEDQISMKFFVDIICRIEICRSIQLYSPGGATFPDCFASFSNPIAVTMVARSTVSCLVGLV